MGTPARHVVPAVAKVEEGTEALVRPEDHRATASAVPAVGPAPGHVLFPPKADAAPATMPALDEDLDLVDEHAARPRADYSRRRDAAGGAGASGASAGE